MTRFVSPCLASILAFLFLGSAASLCAQEERFDQLEPPAFGATYFVSPNGSDNNSGLSKVSAFQTLQHAANQTEPGDTVLIMGGTYTKPGSGATVLFIDRSGTPDNWIRYMAYPGHNPRINVNQHWGGITLGGASYILIEGLTVMGDVRNVSIDYAMEQMSNIENPITSGNGISITSSSDDPTQFPHHVIVRRNHVHQCPGGGITTKHADYVRIENNRVHHNCWTTPYAESGISMYLNTNHDERRAFKMIVRDNYCYRNENYVPHYYSNPDEPSQRRISDGNGIIVDDTRNVQSNIPKEPYKGHTLITGNTVRTNGGRGILVYLSDNVLAYRNTTEQNARSPEMTAEVEVNNSSNIWVIWNSLRPSRDRKTIESFDNKRSFLQKR